MEEALGTVSAFEHTHDNQSFRHLKFKKCKNKDKNSLKNIRSDCHKVRRFCSITIKKITKSFTKYKIVGLFDLRSPLRSILIFIMLAFIPFIPNYNKICV